MKSIKLTEKTWNKLKHELQNNHGSTFLLVRNKALREYGFTVRHHCQFDSSIGYYQQFYYLDVFDEGKITMFLLKYSDFL